MKQIFFSVLFSLFGAVLAFAQKEAMFEHSVNLSLNDTIMTGKWLELNPDAEYELSVSKEQGQELSAEILNLCTHEDLKKIMDSDVESYYRLESFYGNQAAAKKQELDDHINDYALLKKDVAAFINETVTDNVNREYKDNFSFFNWNRYKFGSLLLYKITNKQFRDVLYNHAVTLLSKLCSHYPKDYRDKLIKAFNEALQTMDAMQQHKCEVKENDSMSWKPLMFFIDGVANEEISNGITGFLLRRIYMDNIPYKEVREKTANLIAKLKAIDTSHNTKYQQKYIINGDIAYCITATSNYFVSLSNGKILQTYTDTNEQAYYPHTITCKSNNGQMFYVIKNYQWCNSELKAIIVDKYLNVIYHEPINLSSPILLSSPQQKQSVKSSSSQPKPVLKR